MVSLLLKVQDQLNHLVMYHLINLHHRIPPPTTRHSTAPSCGLAPPTQRAYPSQRTRVIGLAVKSCHYYLYLNRSHNQKTNAENVYCPDSSRVATALSQQQLATALKDIALGISPAYQW